jgi:hypothetical protein
MWQRIWKFLGKFLGTKQALDLGMLGQLQPQLFFVHPLFLAVTTQKTGDWEAYVDETLDFSFFINLNLESGGY